MIAAYAQRSEFNVYNIYLYYNMLLDGSVILSVCSFAIETTFPLSNFKTKHIFGILMTLRKFFKLWGNAGARNLGVPHVPQFLFSFYRPPRRRQMGTWGALKAARRAPLSRRAREIPPKAGASRVYILYIKLNVQYIWILILNT